jgi:hypothetical protein
MRQLFGFLLAVFCLVCGCEKATAPVEPAVPAPAPPAQTTSISEVAPPVATADGPTPGSEPNVTAVAPVPNGPEAVSVPAIDLVAFPEAAYLNDQIFGVIVANPRRFTEWDLFQRVRKAMGEDYERQSQLYGLTPDLIERVSLILDQPTIKMVATTAGLDIDEPVGTEAALESVVTRKAMHDIGDCLLNYHDTFRRFPRANGDGEGLFTGLSWRVHLLPYIGEYKLYEQFHLDEAWDSAHNQTLIEKMPKILASPQVAEPGKTAFHVFTGPGTAFEGAKGKSISDISDSPSETVLLVLAGAESAEIWTKPGGLSFDPKSPLKSLGKLSSDQFLAATAAGQVYSVPVGQSDDTYSKLIQINDGQTVEDFGKQIRFPNTDPVPAMILSLTGPADKRKLTKDILQFQREREHVITEDTDEATLKKWQEEGADEETFNGQTIYRTVENGLWFPDDKTAVCGPLESVKAMISAKTSGQLRSSPLLSQINLNSDLTLAVNLESHAELLKDAAGLNRAFEMAQRVKVVRMNITLSQPDAQNLVEASATTSTPEAARALNEVTQGLLSQGQTLANQYAPIGTMGQAIRMGQIIAKTASVRAVNERVEFSVPVPEDFLQLGEAIQPALDTAAAAAQEVRYRNNLRQIALAFHNHESAFSRFPGAGRSGQIASASQDKVGLSWRVHLLPYLDQAELYREFHLDEPWDSQHNKTLIEKMPKVFVTKGVTESGKTAIHVFTGPGAPFEKDQAISFSAFKDGTSNTILAVSAGPDTAEFWTKPGGLDFQLSNPAAALGALPDGFIRVMLADGSVRELPASIPAETLKRLIQYRDGKRVDLPK